MLKDNYKIIGKRNPIILITNSDKEDFVIQTIGDPHLGRNFRNNLKNRLGEREESIKHTFNDLMNRSSNLTVIMGDLLDKVSITNEWFNFTINSISNACKSNPDKQYVILNGNHDDVKDKDRVSSFNLIQKYFQDVEVFTNLLFVSESCSLMYIESFNTSLYFTNYDPFNSLDELIDETKVEIKKDSLSIAFGHWDVKHFDFDGTSKFINRDIPQVIVDNFDIIVTGHFHKPELLRSLKTLQPTIVTGSMQPYAFGEEITEDGTLYTTITLDELRSILEKNPDAFINSNVKILYNKGDELLNSFNCYSITYKLISNKDEIQQEQVVTEALSFSSLFLTALNSYCTEENQHFIKELERVFLEKDYESF